MKSLNRARHRIRRAASCAFFSPENPAMEINTTVLTPPWLLLSMSGVHLAIPVGAIGVLGYGSGTKD